MSSSTNSSPYLNFFDALRDTIYSGVHEQNYKAGVFRDKISRETDAADSLDILIASVLTTPVKNAIFQAVRKMYEDYRTRGIEHPNLEDFLNTPDEYFMLGELFTQDTEARDAYVTPQEPTIQFFSNNFFRQETAPTDIKTGSETCHETPSLMGAEEKRPSKKNDDLNFGKGLSKNLRGGFI